jgi:hypothetical protein
MFLHYEKMPLRQTVAGLLGIQPFLEVFIPFQVAYIFYEIKTPSFGIGNYAVLLEYLF